MLLFIVLKYLSVLAHTAERCFLKTLFKRGRVKTNQYLDLLSFFLIFIINEQIFHCSNLFDLFI